MTLKTTSSSGVTVEYLIDGSGPQIFILPSLGRAPADYDDISRELVALGYSIVRPNPRGIGRSSGPMTGITLRELADDIALVIVNEGCQQPLVAGHAFGNFVARMLAARHPELVRGIALVAASAGKTESGEPAITDEMHHSIYSSGDLTLPVEERIAHLKKAFFAPGHDPSVWLAGWYPDVKKSQSAALTATPVDDYFGAGSAPIFDLQAENDTIAPRKFSTFLKQVLGDRVTVEVIADAGHALIPEQPAAVVKALNQWGQRMFGRTIPRPIQPGQTS